MRIEPDQLMHLIDRGASREPIGEQAHVAFPLHPGDEGYFSDLCEHTVYAGNGWLDSARLPCAGLSGMGITRLERRLEGWHCALSMSPSKEDGAARLDGVEIFEASGRLTMGAGAIVAAIALHDAILVAA